MLCCYFLGLHFKAQYAPVVVFLNIKSFALTKLLYPQRMASEKRPLIGDTSSQGEFTGQAACDVDLKRWLLLS